MKKQEKLPTIRRFLTKEQWKHKKDFQFLADMARRSKGKLDFFVRMNRVSLYHQGNHVCTMHLTTRPYQVKFTSVFLDRGLLIEPGQEEIVVAGFNARTTTSATCLDGLTAKQVKKVLNKKLIDKIMAAIRWRDYGGEITFEQLLMTQNPPTPEFMIIDRQVSDTKLKRKRMDVLAIRRIGKSGNRYRFCVIEVKLGWNRDLGGPVIGQLREYMAHIQGQVAGDYKNCYQNLFPQLRWLGTIQGDELPEGIEIVTDKVEGMIVVGYAGNHTDVAVAKLCMENPDIEIRKIDLRLCNEK